MLRLKKSWKKSLSGEVGVICMDVWKLRELIEEKEKELFWDKIGFDGNLEKFDEIRRKEEELKVLKEIYWESQLCE